MKKLIIYSFLVTIVGFTSCDPVENRDGYGGPILTIDQVDATVTPVVVNGVNSNKVVVNNNSSILCRWTWDGVISAKSTDTLIVSNTGVNTILFEGYNPDGTVISKDFQVTIDELIF